MLMLEGSIRILGCKSTWHSATRRLFTVRVLLKSVGPKRSRSRDSSVGIATGYRLDCPGPIPGSTRFFSSPQRQDRLWDPSSLMPNGYRGLFSRGQSDKDLKLTTCLHLVPRSRKVVLYFHSPICLHGIMFNKLSTGTNLPLPYPNWRGGYEETNERLTSGYVSASFRYGLLQFRKGLIDLHLNFFSGWYIISVDQKIYTDICRSYRSFQ
jgi:hypothetical protein